MTQPRDALWRDAAPLATSAAPATEGGRDDTGGAAGWRQRLRRRLAGVRLRIVGWYMVLLALALASSLLVARQLLVAAIEERLNDELVQEAEELRALSGGLDPRDGEPFGGRVDRMFEVFLERNLPNPNETMLTFVDGEPFLRSAGDPPLRLDHQPDLVQRWGALRESDRGWVDTEVGRVDYLAVPVRGDGQVDGVFVVAAFTDLAKEPLNDMMRTSALVSGGALLLGLLLAWSVSSRVLAPVRQLTTTARAISDHDLSQRIAVAGNDELAELAATFNSMLDRLEDAFTGQRRFLDDAAHELRTPITIIQGHLELLEDDPVERAETVALVLDELERMNRMVNDLLVLAKARRPDFLQVEPVDLESLVREVHTKAQALAPRRWELVVEGSATVMGDRQRLTQALAELARNATQHTQEGDTITIAGVVDGASARLEVRDSGRGVPPAERARIFERFSRGEQGPRRSEGSGLGLSIVRAIAEAHGGVAELTSAADRPGATFAVVLPLAGAAEGGGAGRPAP